MKYFVIFVFFVQAGALIEWPFTTTNGASPTLELIAGSPPQPVSIAMEFGITGQQTLLDHNYPGLYLLAPNRDNKRGFKSTKSSTFKKIKNKKYSGMSFKYSGVFGTENFVIRSGTSKTVTLKQLPINAITYKDNYDGFLSLLRSKDGNTFVEKLLAKEKEKVVVIVPKDVPHVKDTENQTETTLTGLLALGGRPKSCKNWMYVPEVEKNDENDQWSFNIDSVKIGDYRFEEPTAATVLFRHRYFQMPKYVYEQVIKELGVTENGFIDCNQEKKFVFTIGGKQFELGPKDYISNYYENDPETDELHRTKCMFIGMPSMTGENVFVLQDTFLRGQCFLLDFKQKRIGFGDNLNPVKDVVY